MLRCSDPRETPVHEFVVLYRSSCEHGAVDKRIPVYRQIKQQLTEALRSGRWRHGQRIASETALAQRHGVSVGTIRKSVGELVAENILVREQGRGTFVRSHSRDYMLNVFFRIVGRDGSKELPVVKLLAMKRTRADRPTAQVLKLKPRAPVIAFDTLHLLDGEPVLLDHMLLAAQMFPNLTESQFTRREGTVYGLFQDRFGITVVRADEFITAVLADARSASLLQVAPGTPLLRIERTAYTYKDQPVDSRVRLVVCANHGYLSSLGKG